MSALLLVNIFLTTLSCFLKLLFVFIHTYIAVNICWAVSSSHHKYEYLFLFIFVEPPTLRHMESSNFPKVHTSQVVELKKLKF